MSRSSDLAIEAEQEVINEDCRKVMNNEMTPDEFYAKWGEPDDFPA